MSSRASRRRAWRSHEHRGLLRREDAPRNDNQCRQIVLASRSVARKKLLKKAGLRFNVAFADIDESRKRDERVGKYALRLAFEKAKKVEAGVGHDKPVIIAADTVIAIDSHILGKPRNEKEAVRFLKKLSGRWHKVYTGTAIIDTKAKRTLKKLVVSKVKFLKLSPAHIDWYIKTGEPFKAAGAYSIQGKGSKLIKAVDGCFDNVVGISIPLVLKLLTKLKVI